MKNILLSIVLLFNFFIFPQSLEINHISEYNSSRLPLGYGTNHLCASGSGIWTEIQPRVPRVDYWRVYFVNPDTGLAVGDMGAIIKTTDGGQHWYTIENNYNVSIKALGSYSGQKIIAAGDGGLILKSNDLGENWEEVQSNTTANLWNIQFVNEQTGWIVGTNATALKTTDGGDSWTIKNLPLTGVTYYDVSFLDSTFGYISANGGFVLRTLDGGLNWDITQVGDNYGLFTINAVTRQRAVALGYAGKQVNTTDGGVSWHFKTFLGSIFSDISFVDTLKGYAVGVGGSFQTTDGGSNWEWRMDMTDGLGITFINNETGFMIGQSLINNKTTNAGSSWERTIINDDYTDVFFTNENNGWFVGQNKLYQTTDGGLTLIERDDFPDDRPSSVYFMDSLTGIVGANNKIYKTSNSGESWEEKNIDGTDSLLFGGEFNRIFFLNSDIGWAINTGFAIETIDGGENWYSQLNSSSLEGIYFSDSLNGWIAGGIKPFKTGDGGTNWIEQTNFPTSSSKDVFFNDSLNGFIVSSWTDKLYETNNGGSSWDIVPDFYYGYGRFSNKVNKKVFLIGDPTYVSTDAGDSWNEVVELGGIGLLDFRLINERIGYIGGTTGIIYKYKDTTYTPVELTSFNASQKDENNILLEWITATETNNNGFEIDRRVDENQSWIKIGFINGAGNSTEMRNYKFLDKFDKPEKYYYRLKQIDYDGNFKYSNTINVEVLPPTDYKLNQNYPNPFNPGTIIEFQIPKTAPVKLTVYNLLGERVKELVNNKLEAGYYNYIFNGTSYSSGTYIYTLQSKNYIESRKMILLK